LLLNKGKDDFTRLKKSISSAMEVFYEEVSLMFWKFVNAFNCTVKTASYMVQQIAGQIGIL
jgi:hypothetical protein